MLGQYAGPECGPLCLTEVFGPPVTSGRAALRALLQGHRRPGSGLQAGDQPGGAHKPRQRAAGAGAAAGPGKGGPWLPQAEEGRLVGKALPWLRQWLAGVLPNFL